MDISYSAAADAVRRARWATAAVFFVNGATLASWVPHVPEAKTRLGIGDGMLGLALLAMAAGAVLAMPMAGFAIRRFGSRSVVAVGAVGFVLTLALPVLAPSLPLLALGLFLFGASNGIMDVSMNAQGAAVEHGLHRPVMSSLHAMFSLGGLAGAGVAGLLLWAGVTPALHVAATVLVMLAILAVALRLLLPAVHDLKGEGPHFVKPQGPLVVLGLLAFGAFLGEGAMIDWSAVYLREVIGTGQGAAALGFAAFSLTMTIGRFMGDGLAHRFGGPAVVRAGGLLVALGLGLALLAETMAAALIGFAFAGFGFANAVPILFSAAARTPGVSAGTGIAAVATLAYTGGLAGPAIIGFVAEATTLPVALGIVVVAGAALAVWAGVVRRR